MKKLEFSSLQAVDSPILMIISTCKSESIKPILMIISIIIKLLNLNLCTTIKI